MIKIQKGNEPEKLTKLRQRTIAAGLPPKEAYKRLKNPLKGRYVNVWLTNREDYVRIVCVGFLEWMQSRKLRPLLLNTEFHGHPPTGGMSGRDLIIRIFWLSAMGIGHLAEHGNLWI